MSLGESLSSQQTDDRQRRRFWSEQMDRAFVFMTAILDVPVTECGEGLVSLRDVASESGVDVTFSERDHVLGLKRLYYLREGLIPNFVALAKAMNERGWRLKVEDGFRTRAMQTGLGRDKRIFDSILAKILWECRDEVPSPDFIFKRLTALVAMYPKIGTHMSGSAIDISVLRRDDDAEVDRGGAYIEMSEITPMNSPFISLERRRNRAEITELMARHGFVAYPFEFWHYSKGDAYDCYLNGGTVSAIYGAVDWDPRSGSVTPIEDPNEPLISLAEIQQLVSHALERIGAQHIK